MQKSGTRSLIHRARRAAFVVLLAAAMFAPASARALLTGSNKALNGCELGTSTALAGCFNSVSARLRTCYLKTGQACLPTDKTITKAVNGAAKRIGKACKKPGTLQTLGYGPLFTPTALGTRVQTACTDAAHTLAARTFGGPQAVFLAGPPAAETIKCLKTAFTETATLIRASFRLQSACARMQHRGKVCDLVKLASDIATKETKASTKIATACPLTQPPSIDLKTLTALDTAAFFSRAHEQDRCMVATALADVGPLSLDCGPRPAVSVPPRGQWVQVVLDSGTWGTLCGDGSNFAFWLRLAPTGAPVEKVIVDLQGGGVCLFEGDCKNVKDNAPELFEALSDYQPDGPSTGYLSSNPVDNPFADWTKMALPYCTQDVHIGGGVASVFPTVTVNRYGAVNVRTALRYLRDVLWADMGATTADGYRPDRLQVVFGGESAGGFGVQYNYHYVLDDLRWIHTTAVPDSALALNNGTFTGVGALGFLLQGDPPNGWRTRPMQAPYCSGGECAVGPILQAATAPRLNAVPEQQILNVTNQVDGTQKSTTFFSTQKAWTNAARASYCANQGLNGIHSFMPADPSDIHVILVVPSRFSGLTSAGVSPRDWLSAAMTTPAAVVDRVEEGSLVASLGVNPFSCPVAP